MSSDFFTNLALWSNVAATTAVAHNTSELVHLVTQQGIRDEERLNARKHLFETDAHINKGEIALGISKMIHLEAMIATGRWNDAWFANVPDTFQIYQRLQENHLKLRSAACEQFGNEAILALELSTISRFFGIDATLKKKAKEEYKSIASTAKKDISQWVLKKYEMKTHDGSISNIGCLSVLAIGLLTYFGFNLGLIPAIAIAIGLYVILAIVGVKKGEKFESALSKKMTESDQERRTQALAAIDNYEKAINENFKAPSPKEDEDKRAEKFHQYIKKSMGIDASLSEVALFIDSSMQKSGLKLKAISLSLEHPYVELKEMASRMNHFNKS